MPGPRQPTDLLKATGRKHLSRPEEAERRSREARVEPAKTAKPPQVAGRRMRAKKAAGGTAGKGGVNAAPTQDDQTVRVAAEQLLTLPIDELVPYPNNARVHSKKQIAQIRASLREFGFVTPVLIDFDNNIIAGHGRVEAARAEGMTEVPCVLISSLTEAQRKAYILADNRLSETSSWDEPTLRIELEGLKALHFNTEMIGFDAATVKAFPIRQTDLPEAEKSVEVRGYVRAAPGQAQEETEESREYREFVEKFKPKLTTDDCYTPENIYACVRDWALRHYRLENAEVLRPFYPGGDYQNAEYPAGCVVIDNPPFSILSEICRFYSERDIPYFLFAPALTLFSTASGSCNYLPTGVSVTYHNGAVVNTSFVTNLGGWKIETAPDLYQAVKAADDANRKEQSAELPGYVYPMEVLTSAVFRLAKYGQALRVQAEEVLFVRALDCQRAKKKTIYGSGFLISARAAAEHAAAEHAAHAAEECAAEERAAATKWTLSDREQELIRELGRGGVRHAGTETAHGFAESHGPQASEPRRGGGAPEP